MYNTDIFVHLQIYHDKALYNKENMACLKLSFVVVVSSQITQCKSYTDIKFISITGTFLQVKTETSVYCTITGAHHPEGS